MTTEAWSFLTARGPVTVRSDELVIRSTPGRVLAAQRVRWRSGGWRERARVVAAVAGPPVMLALLVSNLYSLDGLVPPGEWTPLSAVLVVVTAAAVLAQAVRFWRDHVRGRRIPLDDVEEVVVDESEGTLTVVHDAGDGPPLIDRGTRRETLSIPTDGDLREARETFRLRDVQVVETGITDEWLREARNGDVTETKRRPTDRDDRPGAGPGEGIRRDDELDPGDGFGSSDALGSGDEFDPGDGFGSSGEFESGDELEQGDDGDRERILETGEE